MNVMRPRVEPGCAPARLLVALSDRPRLLADLIEMADPVAECDERAWQLGMGKLLRKGMARNLVTERGWRIRGLYVITEAGEQERERVRRQGRAA
ncbi:hypothetical protein Q0M94_28490 (plasmid) [Deinococcus radiomollis]|uniref:hypothetical protein n=1 Tax=Deinococcus radiomollis TaxID=468916 RepID=UPI003891DF58